MVEPTGPHGPAHSHQRRWLVVLPSSGPEALSSSGRWTQVHQIHQCLQHLVVVSHHCRSSANSESLTRTSRTSVWALSRDSLKACRLIRSAGKFPLLLGRRPGSGAGQRTGQGHGLVYRHCQYRRSGRGGVKLHCALHVGAKDSMMPSGSERILKSPPLPPLSVHLCQPDERPRSGQ